MTDDQDPPIRRATTFVVPPRLQLWKVTTCRECSEPFQQLKSSKRRHCPECLAISKKGGKR